MKNRLVLWLLSWYTIPLAGPLFLLWTFVFICRVYCLGDLKKCYNSTQWALFNRNSRWNYTSLSYPLGTHTLERDDRILVLFFLVGGRELKSQIKEMQIYRITLWGLYKVHFSPLSTAPYPGLPMHCLVRISSYSSGRITMLLASVLKYI